MRNDFHAPSNRPTDSSQRARKLRLHDVAAVAVALCLAAPAAQAGPGDCGQPKSVGNAPSAADALEILKTAVGQSSCGAFNPCVCDVDSSGTVVAGDALRVLRRAVGQPLFLQCGCPGSELYVLTRIDPDEYTTSDLEGDWELLELETGPGGPGGGVGAISIEPDGSFAGILEEDEGPEQIEGVFSVSADGLVHCVEGCPDSFVGSLDADRSIIAFTFTPEAGMANLGLLVRRSAPYAQAETDGQWNLHAIGVSGQRSEIREGEVSVTGGDGSYTAQVRDDDGDSADVAGTWTLDASGRWSCASGICNASLQGAMDGGRTLAVASKPTSAADSELLVLVKQGAAAVQADIEGTWFLSSISQGGVPSWERGVVTFAADGSVSGELDLSNGGTTPADGRLLVQPDGSFQIEDTPEFRCSLDSGHRVLVCTNRRPAGE